MCGIVGSFDLNAVLSLALEVAKRGTKGWSLTIIDTGTVEVTRYKESWEVYDQAMCEELMRMSCSYHPGAKLFFILHLVSPTNGPIRCHPAKNQAAESWLWHNGMMDSDAHKQLGSTIWDTSYLNNLISQEGIQALSGFEGSFACVRLEIMDTITVFRNKISPMFIEKSYTGAIQTLCSVKFEGGTKLPENTVVNIITGETIDQFNNGYNPFGV
jgi:hypothetical protein